MLTARRRRALGAFATPDDVARRLATIALDGAPARPVICDPACGEGAFLLAAARALAARGLDRGSIARELLYGCDIDPDALSAARARIMSWSGVDPGDHLVVADGLRAPARWPRRFDAVVGNPPFLNQLERATVRRAPLPPALAPYARAYTDTAWLFLIAARDLLRPGGRAVLVQPQSVVSARDAGPVRAALAADLAGLWWCDELLFDASVHVCAPVIGRPSRIVERWTRRDVVPIAPCTGPVRSWQALVPHDAPRVDLDPAAPTLGDIATATAGFRDEYYDIAAHVVDEPAGDRPLLVTSGLIDVNTIRWGQRPARIGRTTYGHPRVDVAALTPRVRRWLEQRLAPKVVVATQTKVIEAAVDADGSWVPSTPVISVHPAAHSAACGAQRVDPWRLAAVLLAPPVTAWAVARSAGSALAPGAIKLAARDVLDIPLPAGAGANQAWDVAAAALAAGRTTDAAASMMRAYGADARVLDWWCERAGGLLDGTNRSGRPSWRA